MGLLNLPIELLGHITNFFTKAEAIKLSTVCRQLYPHLRRNMLQHLLSDEKPPIFRAVQFHKLAMAKVLLDDCGADINASWHGSTALMLACENRDWKAVDFLLSESTIDITLRNENDETAMDIAIRNGASAIVKRFLTMDLDLQDTGHKVPFPLRHAFDNEQYYIFQLILSDPRTTMDEKARLNLKRTFHAAVRDGDCIAAEMILSLDTAQLALVSLQGEYALHEVVQSYSQFSSSRFALQMVACLLSSCLDIDINHQDQDGRTALWHAVSTDDEKLVSYLLRVDGIDICDCDTYGISPLAHAAEKGTYRVFRLLLSQPGISTNTHEAHCVPPLWAACRAGQTRAVKELLSYKSIDASQPSSTGTTPLHVALSFGHVQIAHLLLNHKPRLSLHHGAGNGLTALTIASSRDFREIVLKLLQHTDIEIDATDHWGRTALWYGAAGGNLDIVQDLCAHPQISRNIADHAGHTAQSIARQHENFDVSDFLGKLDSGASKSKEPQ